MIRAGGRVMYFLIIGWGLEKNEVSLNFFEVGLSWMYLGKGRGVYKHMLWSIGFILI